MVRITIVPVMPVMSMADHRYQGRSFLYRRYQVADAATSGGYKTRSTIVALGTEETAMRKVLVALVAVVGLALAGALVTAPKNTNNTHQASAALGLDILGFTQRARDLPEQSYPTH